MFINHILNKIATERKKIISLQDLYTDLLSQHNFHITNYPTSANRYQLTICYHSLQQQIIIIKIFQKHCIRYEGFLVSKYNENFFVSQPY
jgi:hypothetical protein